MDSSTITQTIIDTINSIFETLFGSIDNNLYTILDDLTFITPDILHDKNFESLLGTSTSDGILLIANSLLLGFLLYYSIRHLLAYFTSTPIERPYSFLIKLILFGICMNFSYFILEEYLTIHSYFTMAIQDLGQNLFDHKICFSELITTIHTNMSISQNSINIFSLDGIIQGILSFSLLNLVFSYSLRYIMIKVFILLTPFAILSASISSFSWFFKAWIRNLFSLLFIQIIVVFVLLILFSMDYSSSNLFVKFIYLGGIYALIKSNQFVKEFIGGISTTVSQTVDYFSQFKK